MARSLMLKKKKQRRGDSNEFRLKCEDIKDVGDFLEIYSKAWAKVKSAND